MDRKVIERRLSLYDSMAPGLNEMLCFFTTVGNFRDITPPALLALKRDLDQKFHTGRYLMSPEWGRHYDEFMKVCFSTYRRAGADAAMRAAVDRQRTERGDTWIDGWKRYFVTDPSEVTPVECISRRYEVLMSLFARDLGVPDEVGDRSMEGPQRRASGSSSSAH